MSLPVAYIYLVWDRGRLDSIFSRKLLARAWKKRMVPRGRIEERAVHGPLELVVRDLEAGQPASHV